MSDVLFAIVVGTAGDGSRFGGVTGMVERPMAMAMTTKGYLTPIETRYRSYRFRSRLEARWRVFFQTLGVPWEYEPQGYKLSDGRWYLPDFRVKLAARFEHGEHGD
jgi:hypothetical protein